MKLLIFVVTFLSLTAYATPRVGNGGDEIGVEFQSGFATSLSVLKTKIPLAYKRIANIDFDELMKNTKVLVVDDSLNAQFKDIVQNSVAINIPDTKEIFINRERWNKIFNPAIKQAIALHEYLSLKGIEQTGVYTVSSQFLTLFGSSMDDALLVSPANPIQAAIDNSPTVPTVQIIQYFFDRADSKFDFDDIPTVSEALLQQPMSCHVTIPDDAKITAYLIKKDALLPKSPEKIYNVVMVNSQNELQDLTKKDIYAVTGFRLEPATNQDNEIFEDLSLDNDAVPTKVSYRKFGNLLIYRFIPPFKCTDTTKQCLDAFYGFCEMNH